MLKLQLGPKVKVGKVGWALPTIPSTIFTHHSAIVRSLPVVYILTAASLQNELVSQ
jgi:hypothetical protein